LDLLLYGPLAILRHIKLQLLLIAVMFGFGTVVFMHYQHLSPLAAFTGSVSTITTIGLYAPNITTMPPIEQIIMVVIFIVSVGLAASLVQSIVTTAVSREILREQLALKRISRLSGHVIVAGQGALCDYTSKWLSNIGVQHVVVTPDHKAVEATIHSGGLAVHGPPEKAYETLVSAGVTHAGALVCVFEGDGDNLLVAMNARRLNPKLRILMSVRDKTVAGSTQMSDVDLSLPIYDVVSQILVQAAYSEEVVGVSLKRSPRTGEYPFYSEFTVKRGGVSLVDLSRLAPVVMMMRSGHLLLNPPDNLIVEAGDVLYTYMDAHSMVAEVRDALGGNWSHGNPKAAEVP
jgi:voltage-gated potassium channel